MNHEIMKFMLPSPYPSCICFNDNKLYIADISSSDLIIFDIDDKSIVRKSSSTAIRPKLIASDNKYIYIYDEVYNSINRIDLNTDYCHPYGSFIRANHPYYGIAVNDEKFFVLSPDIPWYPTKKLVISVYDLQSKVLLDTFDAPTYGSRGLFCDNKCLYTMDFSTGRVFVMDIITGIVIDEQVLSKEHLLDIAVKEDTFYTIDIKNNCILGYSKSQNDYDLYGEPLKSNITIGEVNINNGPETIVDWQVAVSVPDNYLHQHISKAPVTTPNTNEYLRDCWNDNETKNPLIHLNDMPPGQIRQIKTEFEALTRDLRFHLDPERVGTLDDIPSHIKDKYLLKNQYEKADSDEKKILDAIDKTYQFTNKKVKKEAEKIIEEEKNLLIMVLKIFKHVIKEIKYTLPYQSIPVLKVLEEKKGACGNHNAILTSLFQSLGIPTRAIIGFCIWEHDARACYLDHVITEAYIPPYGFIPMDTSRFMSIPNYSGLIGDDFLNFGRLDKRFIINGFWGLYNTDFAKFQYLNKKKITSKGFSSTGGNFFIDWKILE